MQQRSSIWNNFLVAELLFLISKNKGFSMLLTIEPFNILIIFEDNKLTSHLKEKIVTWSKIEIKILIIIILQLWSSTYKINLYTMKAKYAQLLQKSILKYSRLAYFVDASICKI